jgi:hypothetical protein
MSPKRGLFLMFFGIALCLGAMTTAAQAQATRTWVSGVGDDVNPCSRTAPCKTFAGAISKTAAGGEIDALDPAGYGTLTITKAITLDGGGGQVASILAAGTVGFTVNAGANDRVVLRNLRINGINQTTSPGTNGINFVNGNSLAVQNCVIEGFNNFGINFQPAARANLSVTNSTFDNNGTFGTATGGHIIATTAATGGGLNRVSIVNSTFTNGTSGITGGQNTKIEISQVLIGQTGLGGGDFAVIGNAATAGISIDYSTITGNNFGGVHATNGAVIFVANSSITYNNTNGILFDAGGQVISYMNNRVAGNIGGTTFSSTTPQT